MFLKIPTITQNTRLQLISSTRTSLERNSRQCGVSRFCGSFLYNQLSKYWFLTYKQYMSIFGEAGCNKPLNKIILLLKKKRTSFDVGINLNVRPTYNKRTNDLSRSQ
jgi:hypothetical protein